MGSSESAVKRVTVEREEDNFIVRSCLCFAVLHMKTQFMYVQCKATGYLLWRSKRWPVVKCGFADVATSKMRRFMRRRIPILPTVGHIKSRRQRWDIGRSTGQLELSGPSCIVQGMARRPTTGSGVSRVWK